MTESPITILDVARHAGVSPMTVSRVLNGYPDVAENTQVKVQEAIKDLGYVANAAARSLKGRQTNVIGLLINSFSRQYYVEIAAGVSDAANKYGYDLLLYTTSFDEERERERINLVSRSLADGLLIILPRNPEDYLLSLQKKKIPIVTIGHRSVKDKIPSVTADNFLGACAAMRHLITLGHERISFIKGTPHSGQSLERFNGYRTELDKSGLPFDEQLVREGNFSRQEGFKAASDLLDLKAPPTAIFTANDLSAFGAMDAVKDRGLRIPDDVSIIGFDDIPTASQVHPPLTTVRHPLRDIGKTAVHLLLDLLQKKEPVESHVELPSELIIRDSTAQPALTRPTLQRR